MATRVSHHDPRWDPDTLRAICESLGVGVAVADTQGRLLFFNPRAEEILGFGPEGVGPEEWAAVYGCFLPDATTPYPPERMPLARALRGESVRDEVMLVRNPARSDGAWIAVSATPLDGGGGTIRGGVVVFREIAGPRGSSGGPGTQVQGRRGEGEECPVCSGYFKRFRQAYDRISRAVEQTADAVVITDSKGVIEFVNPAFEQTTGYTRREALGATPAILKSGEHDPAFYRHLWDEITAGRPYTGVIVNRKKGGELYWSQQSITPMTDEAGRITHYVSVLKDITNLRRLQEKEVETRLAREVQQRLYPKAVTVDGFDIAGVTLPADDLGGDYFDYLPLSDGTLLLAVGDVAAHGLASALIMVQTRSCLRAQARPSMDLAGVLASLNDALADDLDGRRFVTLLLVHLDPARRTMTYASAGHLAGHLLSPQGEVVQVLPSTGLPLGLFRGLGYTCSAPIALGDGQRLVLVTDGVTEAQDGDGAELGMSGALACAAAHCGGTARSTVDAIVAEAQRFREGAPSQDDVTCVVIRALPASPRARSGR